MLQIKKRLKLTRNHVVFGSCFAVVAAMVGATYAAVPLYYIFCRATGYGGTPNRATSAPRVIAGRTIRHYFRDDIILQRSPQTAPVVTPVTVYVAAPFVKCLPWRGRLVPARKA